MDEEHITPISLDSSGASAFRQLSNAARDLALNRGDQEYFLEMAEKLFSSLSPNLKKENLAINRIVGDSLKDLSIKDGDLVLWYRTKNVRHGDFVFVADANEKAHEASISVNDKNYILYLKKLAVSLGKVQLWSFNKSLKPIELKKNSDIVIRGRALLLLPASQPGLLVSLSEQIPSPQL